MLDGIKRRMPLLGNLYVGQVAFGALVALLGASLYRHYAGEATLPSIGVALRWLGLAGLLLAFGIYLQNVHRFGLVPDYSLKCRYCNGPVNRYSEFCEHCGADLISEEKLIPCPSCEVDLYEGTKHCPECGAAVSASSKRKSKSGGKKAKKKDAPPTNAEVGWSTPIDALTGFPPDDERR